MRKKLTDNLGMKPGALALAVIIWLVIQSVADPVKTVTISNVPVEVRNTEVLTKDGENYTYTVIDGGTASFKIEGKSSIVNRLSASDFSAYADLGKMSQVGAVPVDIVAKRYATQVEILPNTNTLQIELDKYVEMGVKVNVYTTGTPAQGYAVGNTYCEPNMIKVQGPEKLLNTAKELAVYVNVSGQSSDITTYQAPKLYDNNGEEIDESNVAVDTSVTPEITVEIFPTKTIAIEVDVMGAPAEGYAVVGDVEYSPQQIIVAGRPEDLATLSDSLNKTVELDGESETKSGTFSVSEYFDESKFKLVEGDDGIAYKINIEKKVTAVLNVPFDQITLKNKIEGFEYELQGDSGVSVNISGVSADLDQLKKNEESYGFTLDVGGITQAGEYSVKLEAVLPDGIGLATDQYVTIVVTAPTEAGLDSESQSAK